MIKLHKNITLIVSLAGFLVFGGYVLIKTFTKKQYPKKQLLGKKEIIAKIKKLASNDMDTPQDKLPEITIQNFSLQEAAQDKSDVWILTSKEGRIFKRSNQIECIDVSCQVKRDNQKLAQFCSNKSLVDQNKKNVFLLGPVVGNFKELKFWGQNLNYNFSDQTIKTKDNSNYSYPNFNLIAQESFFNLKENRIEMKNGVKTEILSNPTGYNGHD